MISIAEKLNDLNWLLPTGKLLDVFDKYYDNEVSMQENELPATVGKAANRLRD